MKRLKARLSHAIGWRARRLRARIPAFLPVVREIRAATGRSSLKIAGDLLDAWYRLGFQPYVYAAFMLWDVPRERRRDFMASRELEKFLAETLDPEDKELARDKVAFAEHDRRLGLPWLPTLAVVNRHNGVVAEGTIVIARQSELWPALSRLRHLGDLVIKPADGKQGQRIFLVSPDGTAVTGDGDKVSQDEVTAQVFHERPWDAGFGYLVQQWLAPHPDLVALTGTTALSSVRVVIAVSGGKTHVLQAFIKIPAPGSVVDNFRHGTSGALVASVDPETGRLTDLVGMLRPGHRFVVERTSTNPLTGEQFRGRELPAHRELFALAARAGTLHPRTTALGWDIALGRDGWRILDGNPLWGPAGGQASTRAGLRPALERVFPEYFPASH